MPIEPVRDVMRRTIANLAFVERHAAADGPFEVTQLINSFLGALAHPWEALKTDLTSLPLAEASRLGWPVVAKERTSDADPESLGDLVRLMRNSFAHGNVTFLPGAKGDIQAFRIWNIDPRSKKRTWGTIITVADARTFLLCFAALAEDIDAKHIAEASRTA